MVLEQDVKADIILRIHNTSSSLWSYAALSHYGGAAVVLTHHRSGAISDFLVLQVSKFTQDLGSWVLHFQQLQDGCSIVGDGHILSKRLQFMSNRMHVI